MSLIELIITIAILVVITGLVLSAFQANMSQRNEVQTLRNMKMIQLAIQQMTLDNQTNGRGSPIRWTCSNDIPLAYAQWTNQIITNKYLTPEQLAEYLQLGSSDRTIVPLAVADSDPPETVLLVTQNWPGHEAASARGLSEENYTWFLKDGGAQRTRSGGKFNYLPLK